MLQVRYIACDSLPHHLTLIVRPLPVLPQADGSFASHFTHHRGIRRHSARITRAYSGSLGLSESIVVPLVRDFFAVLQPRVWIAPQNMRHARKVIRAELRTIGRITPCGTRPFRKTYADSRAGHCIDDCGNNLSPLRVIPPHCSTLLRDNARNLAPHFRRKRPLRQAAERLAHAISVIWILPELSHPVRNLRLALRLNGVACA